MSVGRTQGGMQVLSNKKIQTDHVTPGHKVHFTEFCANSNNGQHQ